MMKMEDRLTELEIKLAFQDDLLESLSQTVARQQQEIELLQAQMRLLYQQMNKANDGTGGSAGPQHEIPPHY
jgi:SlyX protein